MQSTHHGFLWLSAVALLLLQHTPVVADPFGPWRVMSGDALLVSSTCLGSNATPECLAETEIACQAFSLPPQYTPDFVYVEHRFCRSTGVDWSVGIWPILVDPRLAVGYYTFDSWILSVDDLTYDEVEAGWQPGDLALDVYFFHCTPDDDCLRTLPTDLSPGEVLLACRPTACSYSGGFYRAEKRVDPVATYIMREGSAGWRIVGSYKHLLAAPTGRYWLPPHRYLK